MNIKHDSITNIKKCEEHFSNQDGVQVKYVCTSELTRSNVPMDIFYRETPHPEFGNKYFGIYYDRLRESTMITNADDIENADFAMVNVDDEWHYSSYRHDFKQFTDKEGNKKSIDGGRSYARGWGYDFFKVKDGNFVPNQ